MIHLSLGWAWARDSLSKRQTYQIISVSQVFTLCHPAPIAKLLLTADLPTFEEKIFSQAKPWLNQSQETKLLQSKTHQCYHCLILTPNLSRCTGKWLLYIYINVFSSLNNSVFPWHASSFQARTRQNTKLPSHTRQDCYIASQWLACRGQIFARCWKIPALSNKPEKAWGSPPLFLGKLYAMHPSSAGTFTLHA